MFVTARKSYSTSKRVCFLGVAGNMSGVTGVDEPKCQLNFIVCANLEQTQTDWDIKFNLMPLFLLKIHSSHFFKSILKFFSVVFEL